MKNPYLLCLLLISCSSQPAKKKYTGPCKHFTITELTSSRLRYNAEFVVVLNEYLFKEEKDFRKYFLEDTSVDFSAYAVGGILADNKVAVLENGKPALHDINLDLKVDTTYMKNCELYIYYSALRVDSIPPDGYKKKFFLFKVPKEAGIKKVNFITKNGTSSYAAKMD